MMEHQTWIQDKLGLLRLHIRCKGLSKSSEFNSQARGARASATTAHDISQASTDTDRSEISMQSTDTASTSHQPHHRFRMLFGRLAGHGPVHTDENNALFIPWAKAGDYNSLLQLSGVGSGGTRRERLSNI